MTLRCPLTFASVEDLREALTTREPGTCFLPTDDELPEGTPVALVVAVAQLPTFELEGVVTGPDFDVNGNTGVVVALSEDAREAVEDLGLDRRRRPSPPPSAPPRLATPAGPGAPRASTPGPAPAPRSSAPWYGAAAPPPRPAPGTTPRPSAPEAVAPPRASAPAPRAAPGAAPPPTPSAPVPWPSAPRASAPRPSAPAPSWGGPADTALSPFTPPVGPGTPAWGEDPDRAQRAMLAPGATVDGRFRIEAHIASGGMGDVYRANHVHLKRAVALKLLKPALATDADMWSRFQREAELVSQLESAHVVRVFDFGRTEDGQPYIAMEFVEGITLDEALAEGPLPPDRAVEVLTQVCDGLAEAHALGVIHRDLKPANLMVGRRRDGTEVVKILDFGIARLSDAHGQGDARKLTQTGIVVGTPAYLAPEQATADELDARTDVYALGCVAYELLTGRPPFVSEDLAKVIVAQITQDPEPPEHLRPELREWPALGDAVLKALAKDKAQRFASAAEFARALQAALGGPEAAAALPPLASPAADGWGPDPSAPQVTLPQLAMPPPTEEDLWPVAEEAPPPAAAAPLPRPSAPPRADAAALADFFGDAGPTPGEAGAGGPLVEDALTGLAPAPVLAALRQHAAGERARTAFAFVEVLGVARTADAGKWCQAQLLTAAAAFGGFVEQLDEDGLLLGFGASARAPVARAAAALFAMGEAVGEEARRLGVAARLRAALVSAEGRGRAAAPLERARALLGRVQAGQVVAERALAAELGPLFEVAAGGPEAVQLTSRKPPLRRPAPPELVGRGGVLEAVERRLQGASQAGSAPLVVRGPAGAGKSAVLVEAATRARKRGLVPVVAAAFPSWKASPGALAGGLVCAALGLPFEQRRRGLQAALVPHRLSPSVAEAVLVASGVTQLPWAFTPGQLAHAVRVVLRAVAGERPALLLVDGLEHLDELSLELFVELATHPAPKELLLGFTTPALTAERLGGCQVADLPPLGPPETARLLSGLLGRAPGPRLAALLQEQAQGAPGAVLDWLGLLEDRGSLQAQGNAVELEDDPPPVEEAGLTPARLKVLSCEVQRVLEAAACQGETFEAGAISVAWPRVSQGALQRAVATRVLSPQVGRRWTFASPRVLQAVLGNPSPERHQMHGRLAQGLVALGKSQPSAVDPEEAGRHFLAAGDGATAAALLQHAAEVALARRALRDVVAALQGLAAALGATRQPELLPRRLEWLARAAGTALALQDGPLARALVDEGTALAAAARLESDELSLSLARVMRSEARRSRAAEALARAEALAASSPLKALVAVERGEAREQEGDLVAAMVAYEAALVDAEAAGQLARWHGEVDLVARLEARLGALSLQRKDSAAARRLFESSARRWRVSGVPAAEARALANLGTTAALTREHPFAAKCFLGAAEAASRAGDLLFQSRCLLQQAKALKKSEGHQGALRAAAAEALALAEAVDWEMGRLEAQALIKVG